MLILKLAIKNLLAAGLRTWLSVGVLAFAYLLTIFYNAWIEGWNRQARNETIAWEVGFGQLRQAEYDPYDPFTIQDAHDTIPNSLSGETVPILVRQASIYPQGRMQSVLMKGIETNQDLLKIPTQVLSHAEENATPPQVIIGERMAESANLGEGDRVLMRWRDKNGTFDALEIEVAGIFETIVPAVDQGTLWLSLETLYELTGLHNEATYLVVGDSYQDEQIAGWEFNSQDELLASFDRLIATERISGSFIYIVLIGLALLAIFDTQVLSIFRRQKEIGIFIALGMTRWQVVRMFTIEGTTNSLLGAALAAIIGVPLFMYVSQTGITMPDYTQDVGIAISKVIVPYFGAGIILLTFIIIVAASAAVSFWPSKKIANMDPTLALKGKVQ
jgi:ABC-type lipoprotein release transport system permease subunit